MSNIVVGKDIKPRKNAAKALVGFILLIILLTLGSRTIENLSMANVVVIRPSGGTIERIFDMNGYVEMVGDQTIKAEDVLKVLKVHVSVGSYVELATPVITLDIKTLSEKLASAKIDLKNKELQLQIIKLPVEITTPEEILENAQKAYNEALNSISDNERNAYLAMIEAEKTLKNSKQLLEKTIADALVSSEEHFNLMIEQRKENVEAAQESYDDTIEAYNALTDPVNGTLAKRKNEAYNTFILAESALSEQLNSTKNVLDAAEKQLNTAIANRDIARAEYDAVDPADAVAKKQAKDKLDAAEEAVESARNHYNQLETNYIEIIQPYQDARDAAYNYYLKLADMNSEENKEVIEAAEKNVANALKSLNQVKKDTNKAVEDATNALVNTRKADERYAAGKLAPEMNGTPAEIEAAVKNWDTAQKALQTAIKNREGTITGKQDALDAAKEALDKAKDDAVRQELNNKVAAENKKLEIKNAELEIERVEDNIARMEKLSLTNGIITSPVSGTITDISAVEGAELAEGAIIAKIASDGKTKQLKANVSVTDAKQLKIGMDAEMYTNMMWSMGKVSNISKSENDSNVYVVTFDINPGYGSFNVGDSVRVTVRKSSQRYYTIVPLSALREDSNGKFVFLLQEESGALGTRITVRRVDVTVQEQNNTHAAVSGALSDWDKVVERGDRELKDGDRVRIQQ